MGAVAVSVMTGGEHFLRKAVYQEVSLGDLVGQLRSESARTSCTTDHVIGTS
jgi:hypothetical protein